jgi:hypothetical protein
MFLRNALSVWNIMHSKHSCILSLNDNIVSNCSLPLLWQGTLVAKQLHIVEVIPQNILHTSLSISAHKRAIFLSHMKKLCSARKLIFITNMCYMIHELQSP